MGKVAKLLKSVFGFGSNFVPWTLGLAMLGTALQVVLSTWEHLQWSERIALSLVTFVALLVLVPSVFHCWDWIKLKWKRSFTVTVLPPMEDGEAPSTNAAFWYRIRVLSTGDSDVKSLKCRISGIVPLNDCDAAVVRKLDSLRPDLRRAREGPFGHPLFREGMHANEPVDFDLLVTQSGRWNLCGGDPDFVLPHGQYAILVEVFGEESRPAKKWLLATADLSGHGELLLDEAKPGFSPPHQPRRLTKPEQLKQGELEIRQTYEELRVKSPSLPSFEDFVRQCRTSTKDGQPPPQA